MKKKNIIFTIFITGACVLILEVTGIRILAPYFGNTIYTYSSMISVVLAALSIGYYSGGKIADKYRSYKIFYGIVFVSGILFYLLEAGIIMILPIFGTKLSMISGPLFSSIILFFPPAVFLGTLSPYAIALQKSQNTNQGVGKISGEIFFWSTMGSIIGGLVTGFWLIPSFYLDTIILASGSLLAVIGFFGLVFVKVNKRTIILLLTAVTLIFSLALFFVLANHYARSKLFLSDKEGIYERLSIYDGIADGHPTRFLKSELNNSSAMFLDSDDLVFEYTKYYKLYKLLNPKIHNVLILGSGAYSVPKKILEEEADIDIDVVEIEPSLYGLSQKFFKLQSDARLHNHINDARSFFLKTDKKYDLIFSDLYLSIYSIPAHTLTKEFFNLVKNHLTPDGVFIVNLVGSLSENSPSLIWSIVATLDTAFKNYYFYAVSDPHYEGIQNNILVAINSDKKINYDDPEVKESKEDIFKNLQQHEIRLYTYDLSRHQVFSDRFAPVEKYTAVMLKRYLKPRDKY